MKIHSSWSWSMMLLWIHDQLFDDDYSKNECVCVWPRFFFIDKNSKQKFFFQPHWSSHLCMRSFFFIRRIFINIRIKKIQFDSIHMEEWKRNLTMWYIYDRNDRSILYILFDSIFIGCHQCWKWKAKKKNKK